MLFLSKRIMWIEDLNEFKRIKIEKNSERTRMICFGNSFESLANTIFIHSYL